MSDFEKEDMDCINIQRQHGPGGELPTICSVAAKKEENEKPKDAKWEPVKPENNAMDNLKECVAKMIPVSVISVIVFWWQQSGQLAETTGFYALIALALVSGLTIGKYAMR